MTPAAAARYEPAAMAALRRARRAAAALSPLIFARTYLRSHFSLEMAGMHEDLFEELRRITGRRGSRLAVAAPRGHAKSTVVTLAYALWCLVHGLEPLVVIVSNTAEQATKLLGHLRHELETNDLLRGDFPELAGGRRLRPWRQNSFLLPNGAMALAYGVGQNLRGARHREHRPTLILADDLEDKDAVVQEEQRHKTAEWFRATLLKAGTPATNVVVVGTVLHHDALLAHLLDEARSPGWRRRRHRSVVRASDRGDLWDRWAAVYRRETAYKGCAGPEGAAAFLAAHEGAMLRGTQVLWPAMYTYGALMELRLREGEASFQAEMQNEPLDPAACIFAGARLTYWDDEHPDAEALVRSLGGADGGEFFGACDPSLGGDPLRGDYSAIVLLFRPRGSEVKYVLAADIARRRPDETIERILRYARVHRLANFGVEANQFQELMVEDLRRRAREAGVRVPVLAIKNRSGKQQRIAGLEAEVSQGLIRFARRHRLLMEQLRTFPVGKHDDGPDALEMAVHTASARTGDWKVSDFGGRVLYDSRWPKGVGFGKEDRMPDRL